MPDRTPPLRDVNLGDVLNVARDLLAGLLKDAVRQALEEQKPAAPQGALRASQAADYIGVSRTKFYQLLKQHPALLEGSFSVGKARLWPKAVLDEWIAAQRPLPRVVRAA